MPMRMKMYHVYIAVAVGWSAAALAGTGTGKLPAAYGIFRHKSIFSRIRITYSHRPAPHRTVRRRPMAPVFVGSLCAKGKMIALLESPGSGSVSAVHLHSVIPGPYGGVIVQITLQSLKIVRPGKPPEIVLLGDNLLGTSTAVDSVPATSAPSAPGSSGAPVSPAQEKIIEMLRRQRQQETK